MKRTCRTRLRLWLWSTLLIAGPGTVILQAAAGDAAPRRSGAGERMETVYRVNCGGDTLVDIFGVSYRPDRHWDEGYGYGYLSGSAKDTWHTIGGAPDVRLYQTAHHNFYRYLFEVPNGPYLVTLSMTDYKSHQAGQYDYDLWIMSTLVIPHLDIFTRVERDYALRYRFLAEVTDNQLAVTGIQWPTSQLSAVEVEPAQPDGVAPGVPVMQPILDSFGCVVVNWYDNPEPDLAGYRIYRKPLAPGQTIILNDELSLNSRYLDFTASPDTTYLYQVSAVDVFGNESPLNAGLPARLRRHEETQLPFFDVAIDSSGYSLMNASPDSDLYVPAVLTVNDTVYSDVEIRYRGNVIRKLLKKSYKVRFSDQNPFRGHAHKINLTAEYPDKTLLREDQAYALFRAMGVPCSDTEPVHLAVNGYYMGTYLMVEHVDERFLENHNLEENTLVYKCFDRLTLLPDTASYMEAYTKETMEDGESWGDIIALIEMLNLTPEEAIYDSLIRVFDVENFIDYYATQIAQGSFDWIWKNYFLAHDLTRDRWQIWPWDLDLSYGMQSLWDSTTTATTSVLRGASSSGLILAYRMMQVPVLRNVHLCTLERMMETVFADSVMAAGFQAAYDRIAFDAERDWRKRGWEDNRWFQQGVEELSGFVEDRNAYMGGAVPPLMEAQVVTINEVMAANLTTHADEYGEYDDWIEIYNADVDTLFLAGYYLTHDLTQPYAWAFPDTFLPPSSYLIVWADDDGWQGPLHANFKLSRNGDTVALHRMGTAVEAVDLVFFGPQGEDISWGRRYDGVCPWEYVYEPTPGEPNAPSSEAMEREAALEPRLVAWPNPARGPEQIALHLPRSTEVSLAVYDVTGRRVRGLYAGPVGPGVTRWTWDGRDERGRAVGGGIYWIRAWTPGTSLVQRIVRVR